MSGERRYGEAEVAEILDRATARDPTPALPSRTGLTLDELKEIGAQAGIAPDRIAAAAHSMAVARPVQVPPTKTFFGAPRTVAREFTLPRALTDEEWSRMVADLRATFGARGTLETHGTLRSWTEGALAVHVEPHGDVYRVRMKTEKTDVTGHFSMSLFYIAAAVLVTALLVLTDKDGGGAEILMSILAALMGMGGVAVFAHTRLSLPGWASKRAEQMNGLAERIPLLLDPGPTP